MTANEESRKLSQGAVIDLYEIDLRQIKGNDGKYGELLRFCNEQNQLGTNVVWQGNEYQSYPVQGDGFEMSGTGTSNRPTLTLSNLFGLVTAIASKYDEAVGAIVVRRRVYECFLDEVNFEDGNTRADVTQELVTTYLIESLKSNDSVTATFELSLPSETDNALLPARMVTADSCGWVYRSSECGYTGPAVATDKDKPTTVMKEDVCSRCLSGCKLRNNTINFGGFPSVNKLS